MDKQFNDTLGKLELINQDIINSIQLIKTLTNKKDRLIKDREQLQAEIDKYITEDY